MSEIHVFYSFPLRVGTIGPGMTAWHQVVWLVRQGVQVTLYAGSCERAIHGLNDFKETLVPYGVKVPISLLGARRAKALHDKIVAKAIRRIHNKSKIDIVHCWPSGSLETLRTARELGIRTLLERPNTHTRYAFEVVAQECKKLGIKLPKRHSHAFDARKLRREEKEFELADRLLCPSRFVSKIFLDLGFKKEKIAHQQYGFEPDLFFAPTEDRREENNVFKILFVGSGEPRKGLHYALDAWLTSKASENGVFYICGGYIRRYRKLLAGKLAHPSVKEIGFDNNVSALMQKCHALILPTIEEGSALVTYEARACGCVILVSEAAGAHCRHMYDALVHKVGDVDSLRKHIDMVASDGSFYRMLKKNSLDGLDQLTWEKAAEILVGIYRQTLNSNGR